MSQRCSKEEFIRNVGKMHFSGMPELKVRQQEAGRGLGERAMSATALGNVVESG